MALFYHNLIAAGDRHVEGGDGRGDVEGDAVVARERREGVGADFIRHVAVGGDAVGSDDDGVDGAAPHERPRRRIRDEARLYPFAPQLPRGEARALQQRAGFCGVNALQPVLRPRRADDSERRPVAAGRKRARVAVSERAASPRDELRAVDADSPVAFDVFAVDARRFKRDAGRHFVGGLRAARRAERAFDRPRQIGAGGSCPLNLAGGCVEAVGEVPAAAARQLDSRQRQRVSARDADSRRAAHRHVRDAADDGAVIRRLDPRLLAGQPSLIEQAQQIPPPDEGRKFGRRGFWGGQFGAVPSGW